MENTVIVVEEAKEAMRQESATANKVDSVPSTAVFAATPVEEETTEGFVLDVIEGDTEHTKPEKMTSAALTKMVDDYDDRFFGRPKTEEEYLAESRTLSYKIKDFCSWLVIAFLVCVLVAVLVYHFHYS